MEIDIAQVAAQTAALLAPFLPYLIKGGKIAAQKAFEKAGEKFTEATWAQAEKLWEKLKPKVEAKPAAQDVVEEFIKDPREEDALPSLRQQIKKILEKDPGFAEEISITVGDVDASIMQAGDDSILIKGNVSGNLIKGDRNIIAEQIQIFIDQKQLQTIGDREKIENAYRLYLEKLRRHCNALPLAALGEEESSEEEVTLDKIYIDLDTTQFKESPDGESQRVVRSGSRQFVIDEDKATPLSVMEVATETKRLITLQNE